MDAFRDSARSTLQTAAGRTGIPSPLKCSDRERRATTKVLAYGMDYGLDLFSNFTYLLNDPVNGDQFEQVDRRRVFGALRQSSPPRAVVRPGARAERGRAAAARPDWAARAVRHPSAAPALGHTRGSRSTNIDRHLLSGRAGIHGQVQGHGRSSRRSLPLRRAQQQSTRTAGAESAGLLSPKLGVVFAPSNRIELYGNFGYGYHSNDARGATITIDPATGSPIDKVTPLVRTRGGEFGLRSILVPRLQTTVAVWGLALDSELVFVGDAGTTEAGRPSRRFGVEWTNYYHPRPWLTVDADLSWSSARFTDHDPIGSQIPGAVRHVASAGVSVSELGRWSGQLRLRYLGPRPIVEDALCPRKCVPGCSMLEAGYRLAKGTRLALDVLNLFNARASDIDYYYPSRLPGEPDAGVDDVHSHPVSPRTARVSLRFDF